MKKRADSTGKMMHI